MYRFYKNCWRLQIPSTDLSRKKRLKRPQIFAYLQLAKVQWDQLSVPLSSPAIPSRSPRPYLERPPPPATGVTQRPLQKKKAEWGLKRLMLWKNHVNHMNMIEYGWIYSNQLISITYSVFSKHHPKFFLKKMVQNSKTQWQNDFFSTSLMSSLGSLASFRLRTVTLSCLGPAAEMIGLLRSSLTV